MDLPGRAGAAPLPDGRRLEYWDGGDPAGAPVVLMPGTPSCRWQGAHGHPAAVAAGVRLVAVSRPGYGASTPTPPGLASVGRDAVDLADALGLGTFAVLGLSGGGPYAVATALAAPDRVSVLGVCGGIGPWALLDEPVPEHELDRSLVERAAAGDVDGALAAMCDDIDREMGGMLARDDDELVDAFLADVIPDAADLADDLFRAVWAADLREALRRYVGCARDNLAWGGHWDVDPTQVSVPTLLWYGDADRLTPMAHARWLADLVPGARLTVHPGEDHGHVVFGHWAEMLGALVAEPGR
jgi:pimeloyl-ACP methyl ester carboxylesterase